MSGLPVPQLDGAIGATTRQGNLIRFPVELHLEEAIARITVDDEDTYTTGRFDILAINKAAPREGKPFGILIIEVKNSSISLTPGLPQLLTYAHQSLMHQDSVWGWITNGTDYQFVSLRQGSTPTYQLMPTLHLFEPDRALQLLQTLKALCQLQGQPKPAVA